MILYRYMAKHILIASGFVILVVAGLAFLITLLGELKDIGVGDYTLYQAIIYVGLRLPFIIYQFFPMLVLVGGIVGLGILASNRELIVMRASGFSFLQISLGVILAGFILILFATFLGEYVAPRANYIAHKQKDSLQNNGQAVATAQGVWIHEGNNFLHIDRVNNLEHLEGVTRYEFDNQHQLLAAYFAKYVIYHQREWHLYHLVKTIFTKNGTESQTIADAKWNLPLNPSLLNVGITTPDEMSIRHLFRYAKHLTENHLEASDFQFEFWQRIFKPLTMLLMMLLTIPFVLGSPRSVSMGWRILLGVIIGFSFYMLNALFGQISIVFQLSPLLAAVLPTLFVALALFVVFIY